MIYSHTPAHESGVKNAHIFVETESKFTDVFGARDGTAQKFLEALQDWVCFQGAPTKLIGNAAHIYKSWPLLRYLQDIFIPQWQCKTHYQHQNPAEQRFEVVKRLTNRTLAKYNVPSKFWLLCMTYIAFVLNHTIDLNLAGGTMTPYTMAMFEVTDISPILCFHF